MAQEQALKQINLDQVSDEWESENHNQTLNLKPIVETQNLKKSKTSFIRDLSFVNLQSNSSNPFFHAPLDSPREGIQKEKHIEDNKSKFERMQSEI